MKLDGSPAMSLRRSALLLVTFGCSGLAAADCENGDDAIRLNQVGFGSGDTKRAILVTAADKPLAWTLVDEAGQVRLQGNSRVFGDDALSGQHLHRIDFTAATQAGAGFRLKAGCTTSHPFRIAEDAYGGLRFDALAYFYHNRSGVPIEPRYAGGAAWARPAGHVEDVASCRSGRDSHGNDWPGCDYSLDVTGGWYDAGDHGKYVVNGGIAVWTLLNLYEWQQAMARRDAFADGEALIPESGNGISDLLDEARFELEFLLRMQAPAGAVADVPVGIRRNGPELPFSRIDASGMAHHKVASEYWTALPTAPHEDRLQRYLFPVSTAATLNLAAVSAQCARIWRGIDADFAARCLAAAQEAYAAARRNPEVYFLADFTGSGLYGDGDVSDEFFWAAAELFATTGDGGVERDLRASPHFAAPLAGEPGWPRTAALGLITLSIAAETLPADDRRATRGLLIAAADRFRSESAAVGYAIPFASDRYVWGSNGNLLNRAIVLALAADFTGDTGYRAAVVDVMDYLLGRNPLDQSYVSGYGERPLRHPHHRHWALAVGADAPAIPAGALSGGPNNTGGADDVARELRQHCAPQTCWVDDVRAYSLNEVAVNWNAPLIWVAAWLAPRSNRTQ